LRLSSNFIHLGNGDTPRKGSDLRDRKIVKESPFLLYCFSFQGLDFQGAMALRQKFPVPDFRMRIIAQARKKISTIAEAGVVKYLYQS